MSRLFLAAALALSTFAGLSLRSANAQNYWGGGSARKNHNHGCGTSSSSNYSSRGYDPYYTSRSSAYPRFGNTPITSRYGYGYDRQYPAHRAHTSHYRY